MRELIGSFARCRDGRPTTSAPAHSPLAPPIHHSHHPFTTRTTHSPPAPPIHHPLNADAEVESLEHEIADPQHGDQQEPENVQRHGGCLLVTAGRRRRRSAGGEWVVRVVNGWCGW